MGKFFLGQWGPNKIEAFEVGVAVVDHVVANVPQAVGGEGGQKGDAADPFVQAPVRGQALVAGVVANDEQATNHEASGHGAEQFGPPIVQSDGAEHEGGPNAQVDNQQNQGFDGGLF